MIKDKNLILGVKLSAAADPLSIRRCKCAIAIPEQYITVNQFTPIIHGTFIIPVPNTFPYSYFPNNNAVFTPIISVSIPVTKQINTKAKKAAYLPVCVQRIKANIISRFNEVFATNQLYFKVNIPIKPLT